MALINVDWSKITVSSPYFIGNVTKLQNITNDNKGNATAITTAKHIENTEFYKNCYNITKLQYKNNDIGKNIDWQELFEECAAIMEYDGGLSRIDAEVNTFNELVYKFCDQNNCKDTDFAVSALLALGLKNPYHKAEYK